MFRLEAFIEDKKLAKVMTVLDGLVVQLNVNPVRNAIAKAGKVVEAGHPTSGPQVVSSFIQKLREAGEKSFSSKELVAYGGTYGVKETTVWAALSNARIRKQFGYRLKSRGVYNLTPTGAK